MRWLAATVGSHNCGKATSLIVALLLFLHLSIVSYGNVSNFPNIDELAHLPSGVAHLRFGDFRYYRVNPPLTRIVAALPKLVMPADSEYEWSLVEPNSNEARPEFTVGFRQLEIRGLAIADDFVLPRFACLVFTIVGFVTIFLWGRAIAGTFGGVAGAMLWSTSPNIISNAQSICPDLAATSLGVAACFCMWRWNETGTWSNAFLAGLTFGLALLTKLTWLTGFVAFPLCIILGCYISRFRRSKPCLILQSACVFLIAIFVLNSGYLFSGTLSQLDSYRFRSKQFGGPTASADETNNRFVGSASAMVPVPFPRDYVLGVDFLRWEVERKDISFLAGELKMGSWLHYYAFSTLLKTPLSTLLLCLQGIALATLTPRYRSSLLFLAIPSLIIFMSVSLQGGFNHHHRYVLPIYPFLFLIGSICFHRFYRKSMNQQVVCIILLICSAVNFAISFPYIHSYFNLPSGGPTNGYRWLHNSNIEWGQDIGRLAAALRKHGGHDYLVIEVGCPIETSALLGQSGASSKVVPASGLAYLAKRLALSPDYDEITFCVAIEMTTLSAYPEWSLTKFLEKRSPVCRVGFSYAIYTFALDEYLQEIR